MQRCNTNIDLMLSKASIENEVKLKAIHNDTISACRKFGAYEVRKAARRQMAGDNDALAAVGLAADYKYEDMLYMSNLAFDRLTAEEVHHEFCVDVNIEYWPLSPGRAK